MFGAIPPFPQYVFMAWYRDYFTCRLGEAVGLVHRKFPTVSVQLNKFASWNYRKAILNLKSQSTLHNCGCAVG
jgi:hypothetical protein